MKGRNKLALFAAIALVISSGCESSTKKSSINTQDVQIITDSNPSTFYKGTSGENNFYFKETYNAPVLSYKVYSSGENPASDPFKWVLKGSNDGENWSNVDERNNQVFCARFQEIMCTVQKPGNYKYYLLQAEAADKHDLCLAEVNLFTKDLLKDWTKFNYPQVHFELASPEAEGTKIYGTLVQNPDEYVKYHTQKVAEILFFSDRDPMNDVQKINYTLKEYEGISAKGGNPPEISIEYSTKWVERSAKESLYKLDYETRGVLYHELTHAYQNEPHGIGDYGSNKIFWAMIEGEADAVRAHAGLFDFATQRKAGGHWMDGYKTTGFFIEWLTTKDPDAIRKFNQSARELPVWSFDGAMQFIFGEQATTQALWDEYQAFLTKGKQAA